MSTQWRVGHNGAYGLDYNALKTVIEFFGIKKKNRLGIFEDVRIMEEAALSAISKGNK